MRLVANAWVGRAAAGSVDRDYAMWAAQAELPKEPNAYLFPQALPDLTDWRDPRVGWGLVLRDDDRLPVQARARADDAPEPIRQLVADRGNAPVLRYARGSPKSSTSLMRYYEHGAQPAALPIEAAPLGTAANSIPYYLLIYGGPADIPWSLQYTLNTRFAVGRLDLTGDALTRYVTALISSWKGASSQPQRVLVWATDRNDVITTVMKATIAKPLFAKYAADADLNATFIGETTTASADGLLAGLSDKKPRLVVSTSHGDTQAAGGRLEGRVGLPIDDAAQRVEIDQLLDRWQPDGAIWYQHACCSAGTSSVSVYDDLFTSGSDMARMLGSVRQCGDMVAPLPQALLGHDKPARAFIGHVEPTFDWTLRRPGTGADLTNDTVAAFYDWLFQADGKVTLGRALREFFAAIGTLSAEQLGLKNDLIRGDKVGDELLAAQLAARDRMSTVILGDPSVTLGLSDGPAGTP